MSFGSSPYLIPRQTFFVSALSIAPASGKSMISIANASSGVVIRLHAIQVYNVLGAPGVGVNAQFDLNRFSTHSGGTALTPVTYDTQNVLSAGVSTRTNATLVGEVLAPLRSYFVDLDDISAGSSQNQAIGSLFGQDWQPLAIENLQPPTDSAPSNPPAMMTNADYDVTAHFCEVDL